MRDHNAWLAALTEIEQEFFREGDLGDLDSGIRPERPPTEPPIITPEIAAPARKPRAPTDPSFWSPAAASFFAGPSTDPVLAGDEPGGDDDWDWQLAISRARATTVA